MIVDFAAAAVALFAAVAFFFTAAIIPLHKFQDCASERIPIC